MERLVIDLILQCSTLKGACAIAGISWDQAWGIMQLAVARGQARKEPRAVAYIGVDEKAFRKGSLSYHAGHDEGSGRGAEAQGGVVGRPQHDTPGCIEIRDRWCSSSSAGRPSTLAKSKPQRFPMQRFPR
jgi:hypothetical protein